MEETAAAMGTSPRWYQLYWSRDEQLVDSFIHRAEAIGAGALVVTLDTTLLGWRPATGLEDGLAVGASGRDAGRGEIGSEEDDEDSLTTDSSGNVALRSSWREDEGREITIAGSSAGFDSVHHAAAPTHIKVASPTKAMTDGNRRRGRRACRRGLRRRGMGKCW